jgi:hypothetical protein|tara:strand:+ start:185 stop:463 length:279 start_codon:yes stop_codon:yes gene_type:complete
MKNKTRKIAVAAAVILSYSTLIVVYGLLIKAKQRDGNVKRLTRTVEVLTEDKQLLTEEVLLLESMLEECSGNDGRYMELFEEYIYDGEGCSH